VWSCKQNERDDHHVEMPHYQHCEWACAALMGARWLTMLRFPLVFISQRKRLEAQAIKINTTAVGDSMDAHRGHIGAGDAMVMEGMKSLPVPNRQQPQSLPVGTPIFTPAPPSQVQAHTRNLPVRRHGSFPLLFLLLSCSFSSFTSNLFSLLDARSFVSSVDNLEIITRVFHVGHTSRG
jgi:hypothetical protein